MKIRRGFVSNSSSCSFITIGFILNKKDYPVEKVAEMIKGDSLTEEEKKDPMDIIYEGCKYSVYLHGEDGMKEGEIGIGTEIFTSYEDDPVSPFQYSIDEIKKVGSEIKAKYNFDGEAILFGGMRMC